MLLVKLRESKNCDKQPIKTKGCVLATLLIPNLAAAQSTQSITNPTSVVSIFLSLLLVVGVIFMLAYLMRRFNVTPSSNAQMKVVASMAAGAKERIMVLQVGDEQHLIGITSQQINHLAKLENNIEANSQAMNSGDAFKQKLISAMAGKMKPSAGEKNHDH